MAVLTAEEAERHAARIRPLWEDPERLEQCRASWLASQPDESRAKRVLSALEADRHAAQLRAKWELPSSSPAGSAAEAAEARALLESALHDTERALDEMLRDPAEREALQAEAEAQFRRTITTQKRRLRLTIIAAGAALGLVLLGIVIALASRKPASDRGPSTSRSALSATLPAAAPAPTASLQVSLGASPAAVPQAALNEVPTRVDSTPSAAPGLAAVGPTVRVRISAEPPRARIRLDGKLVPNPFDERLASGTRRRVLIQARGHAERDYMIAGDRDERIQVVLEKLP
jgi:hypothetical protein